MMTNDKFERYSPSGDSNKAEREMHISRYFYVADFINKNKAAPASAAPVRILDCGCGTGFGTKIIAERTNSPAVGLDYSQEAIEYAKQNQQSSLTEFLQGDATKLPFTSGEFNYVVSIGVLQQLSLEQADKAITEMMRVLAPGGHLIIQLPNKTVFAPLKEKYGWAYKIHKYEFSPEELSAMLVKNGLSIQSMVGQHPYFPLYYRLFNLGLFPSFFFHPNKIFPINHCIYFMVFAKKEG